MTTRRVIWFAFDVDVPDGAEPQVDAVLTRWVQDLRHRLLPSGIEVHDGVGKLLPMTLSQLEAFLAHAARVSHAG